MPKKNELPISQVEQSRRFEEAARAIEADGGLSPEEAAKAMERALAGIASVRPPKATSEP
jgi:hypothetical protein